MHEFGARSLPSTHLAPPAASMSSAIGAHSYSSRSFALAAALATLLKTPLFLIRMWYTSGTMPPVYRSWYLIFSCKRMSERQQRAQQLCIV